jgi:origin recognition complex subunit 1
MNGMELRHPYDAYIRLWEALVGRKHVGTYENASDKIREVFNAPASTSSKSVGDSAIVILLDEIDYLITEKQTVLFDFFDWPKCAAGISGGHRLVVVGVSNTLNLTDQLLPKVQSRVGSEKCIFKAYSLQDTISILRAKMEEASPVSLLFVFCFEKSKGCCN